jgi:cytochrome c553
MTIRLSRAALTLLAGALLSMAGSAVHADDTLLDQDVSRWRAAATRNALPPVEDRAYRTACGGCHLAYQPGLLSAASWEKLLGNLSSHFGDNAELPAAELNVIRNYLLNNAAGRVPNRISDRLINSIGPGQTPIRISEIPYFVREHRELPADAVAGDPAVRSLSHCGACHTQAEQGRYDEPTPSGTFSGGSH